MHWVICSLFMLTFTGLSYVLFRAFGSGADAYSNVYSTTTAREFEDIFIFIPPRRIAEIGWACSAIAFLIVFLATGDMNTMRGALIGLILGAIAGTLALQTPGRLLAFLRTRRRQKFSVQLVGTLLSMSNALRAGFSILQTFETVVKSEAKPISEEFDVFLQQTRVGVSFSDALRNLDERVQSEDLTLMIQSIEIARQTGGNLTEIFEKISATIRERMRIERRIRTLTAQGRLQGMVVGAMPLVIGIGMFAVDPELMRPFVHSAIGIIVMIGVGLLIAAGAFIIKKIITIDV